MTSRVHDVTRITGGRRWQAQLSAKWQFAEFGAVGAEHDRCVATKEKLKPQRDAHGAGRAFQLGWADKTYRESHNKNKTNTKERNNK